jgi:hypothetical protein
MTAAMCKLSRRASLSPGSSGAAMSAVRAEGGGAAIEEGTLRCTNTLNTRRPQSLQEVLNNAGAFYTAD